MRKKGGPLSSFLGMGIQGLSLSKEEKKGIQKAGLFGLILFKRNIESLNQLFELCREIHSVDPHLLIMMDREGGKVDRLSTLSDFPSWPSPAELSRFCTLPEIEKTFFYLAREMRLLGITLNFAPCVDLPSVSNTLFEGRLWGKTAEEITRKARACMEGLHRGGVRSCIKHFPGHGGVSEDSHLCLPVDRRPGELLKSQDLIPFQKMISFGGEMVMTAHILYPEIDPQFPATLSPVFLQKILRGSMGFSGLIISDDLDMQALSGAGRPREETALCALKAGVDVLLKCEATNIEAFISDLEKAWGREKGGEEEFFLKSERIKKFKHKVAGLSPLSSFSRLKKELNDSKVWKWYDTLQEKRVKSE